SIRLQLNQLTLFGLEPDSFRNSMRLNLDGWNDNAPREQFGHRNETPLIHRRLKSTLSDCCPIEPKVGRPELRELRELHANHRLNDRRPIELWSRFGWSRKHSGTIDHTRLTLSRIGSADGPTQQIL